MPGKHSVRQSRMGFEYSLRRHFDEVMMFKYTPAKKLLHWYRKNHRRYESTEKSNRIFAQEMAMCGNDFLAWCEFRRCWEHTCFYSPVRIQKVPVNGWLFPVEIFDEMEI